MKAALEKALMDTARVVSEWTTNRVKIEVAISDANARLAKAAEHRQRFALDASLGNPKATAEIIKHRAEHACAQNDLIDLQHALSAARLRLVEAEGEAKTARNNLARFNIGVMIRKRIDVAGQLDDVIADFARRYRAYEALGHEIINTPDALPQNGFGMTNHEGALGARRVRASLPAFFWKLFPGAIHDEMKTENLATSEARYWGPEHEKAKAA